MTNVREVAFEALLSIDKNITSNTVIKDVLDKYSFLEKQDRSFLSRILEGTIERRITIDYILGLFSKVSVKEMKPPVRTLLRMGVYQIMYMDAVPDSAAVNETVKIAKKRGLGGLSGYINGVLRNVSRNKDNIEYPDAQKDLIGGLSVIYSCPEFIVKLLVDEQGIEGAKKVLEGSVSVRPITARVNITKTSPDELCIKYPNNITKSDILPYAVSLHNIDKVSEVQAIIDGEITVQDISSMLVCNCAGIRENMTVLDMCAAPGGKTMHAADMARNGRVISCDVSYDKADRICDNISRCGFTNVDVRVADATVYNAEFDSCADVVIADVPCSGLGVMGRKNDIKYRLSSQQLDELVLLQRRILKNATSYVKPGGILMFSTCTVHHAENIDNFNYLIDEFGFEPIDFYDCLPEVLRSSTAKEGYIQLLGDGGITDGFFISKLRRVK